MLRHTKKRKYKVGEYYVILKNFGAIALPVFDLDAEVLFIAQISRMELLSQLYRRKVEELVLHSLLASRVVETIPIMRKVQPHYMPLIEKLRADEKSKVVDVTKHNRDDLPDQIARLLAPSFS